ncbi:MAG: PrsW family intramembrane metalloprotease [Haloarculaceae archaeon]
MHPRKLLRIARWEVTKNAGSVDGRTVLVALVAIVLLGGVIPFAAGGDGVALDAGIYRVGVTEDSPYYGVAATDETFAIVERADERALEAGDVELLVRRTAITAGPSAKARAAKSAFRDAVERYNDAQMGTETNQTAAFPVDVILQFVEQENAAGPLAAADGGSGGGNDGAVLSEDSGEATDGTGAGTGPGTDGDATADDGRPAGGLGGFGGALSGDDGTAGTPSQIAPPFPFESLVLAFVFIVPLNFLIQAYGSTMLSERINRRGELLLVSPVTRFDIIGGKTLPYFLGALAVEGAIAGGLTFLQTGQPGGLLSLLAVTPLVLLFLGATFLGAMFARSFKELTFVTVTITVTLTSYAFVPAIFTESGPVALISPLTIVVRDLQGEAVTAVEFLFSTTPPTLSALVLFGLGAGLYREEDMFTQRAIPLKVLDALAGRIRRRWHVALVSALLLPFVFVAELLAIALLFALGQLSIPLVLVFVALVEEAAKSLHVYAGYVHGRFDHGLRTAVVLGALSGFGFFVGEKLTLLAQLVGLQDLAVGEAALTTGIVSGPVLLAFLLAPLVLHTVTASISALGARRGRRGYAIALGAAVLVHLGYNLTVVGLGV